MKKALLILLFALFVCFVVVPAQKPIHCPQHPKPVPLPDKLPQVLADLLAKLEQAVPAMMKENNMVGASLGIVYDQKLIWSKGFGVKDRKTLEPVTPDTLFRIGSLTKIFTVISLMQQRDAGKVSLDDPVSKYWPNFQIRSKYSANSRGITFKELASQLSGVFSGSPCSYLDTCDITTEEAFDRLAQEQVVLPSDLLPHYSDVAYAILGRALEKPAGATWEELLTKLTLGPLGMNSTGYDFTLPGIRDRLATGYFLNYSLPFDLASKDLGWARPTGQLYSSVNDLSKFLSFLFSFDSTTRNNVLLGSSIREILLPAYVNDDQSTGFGFPFERAFLDSFYQNGMKYWGVSKGGAFPGYTTFISTVPALKLGFIAQNNGNSAAPLVFLFSPLLVAFDKYLQSVAPPPPAYPGNLSSFVGSYRGFIGFIPIQQKVTLVQERWVDGSIIERLHMNWGTDVVLDWLDGDSFQLKLNATQDSIIGCINLESGINNEVIFFQKHGDDVISFTLPATDPYYGVTFKKHS